MGTIIRAAAAYVVLLSLFRIIGRRAVDQHERRAPAASPHRDRRPVPRNNLRGICAHRSARLSSIPVGSLSRSPPQL